jgi:hypothetical protein
MNSIDAVRRINQIARKYYYETEGIFDHTSYLSDCFGCLVEFFNDLSLPGSGAPPYIFSALTSKNEDKDKIEVVKLGKRFGSGYHFVDGEVRTLLEPTIDRLLTDIQNKQCLSLTETLLKDKRRGKDLFIYSNKPYRTPIDSSGNPEAKISFYPLTAAKFESNVKFEDFVNENTRNGSIELFKRTIRQDEDEFNAIDVARLLWYYKELESSFRSERQKKEFIVHFIRPSLIEFGYNILLSLATDAHLNADQLSFIYLLIYRIVNQMAIEKAKEVESLKRKTSYSLTSHSFKTVLSTTIIPQTKSLSKVIQDSGANNDSIERALRVLLQQSEDLFRLTGIISLIDKVDKKKDFLKSGHADGLISPTVNPDVFSISEYSRLYNEQNPNSDDIVIDGALNSRLVIKVFQEFLTAPMITLFYKTLFENLIRYAKRTQNRIILTVSETGDGWMFENGTRSKTVPVDPTKLTGNLSLFKTLIENTKSGSLTLDPSDYKFRIVYRPAEYQNE